MNKLKQFKTGDIIPGNAKYLFTCPTEIFTSVNNVDYTHFAKPKNHLNLIHTFSIPYDIEKNCEVQTDSKLIIKYYKLKELYPDDATFLFNIFSNKDGGQNYYNYIFFLEKYNEPVNLVEQLESLKKK